MCHVSSGVVGGVTPSRNFLTYAYNCKFLAQVITGIRNFNYVLEILHIGLFSPIFCFFDENFSTGKNLGGGITLSCPSSATTPLHVSVTYVNVPSLYRALPV